MDYNTLVAPKSTAGSIADWVNNSRIAADAGFIIDEAMSMIYETLRHWRMITPLIAGQLTVGEASVPLPSDIIEPYTFSLVGQQKRDLMLVTQQECINTFTYDGSGNRINQMPKTYYFDQANFQFNSPPDQAYNYMLSLIHI